MICVILSPRPLFRNRTTTHSNSNGHETNACAFNVPGISDQSTGPGSALLTEILSDSALAVREEDVYNVITPPLDTLSMAIFMLSVDMLYVTTFSEFDTRISVNHVFHCHIQVLPPVLQEGGTGLDTAENGDERFEAFCLLGSKAKEGCNIVIVNSLRMGVD